MIGNIGVVGSHVRTVGLSRRTRTVPWLHLYRLPHHELNWSRAPLFADHQDSSLKDFTVWLFHPPSPHVLPVLLLCCDCSWHYRVLVSFASWRRLTEDLLSTTVHTFVWKTWGWGQNAGQSILWSVYQLSVHAGMSISQQLFLRISFHFLLDLSCLPPHLIHPSVILATNAFSSLTVSAIASLGLSLHLPSFLQVLTMLMSVCHEESSTDRFPCVCVQSRLSDDWHYVLQLESLCVHWHYFFLQEMCVCSSWQPFLQQ